MCAENLSSVLKASMALPISCDIHFLWRCSKEHFEKKGVNIQNTNLVLFHIKVWRKKFVDKVMTVLCSILLIYVKN